MNLPETLECPACGASLHVLEPALCESCGWAASDSEPEDDAQGESVETYTSDALAERLRAATGELREDSVKELRGRGYYVVENPSGVRIQAAPTQGRRPDELSPSDIVKLAAEQQGGVKPSGELPMCPECQSASPVGSSACQWCGAALA